MCRIFGCLGANVPLTVLGAVSSLQRHGGPDEQGVATGRGWSLGSNRLAITDPSGGRQPYCDGDVTVVLNGEIYNHAELRRELEARGHRFADRCDGSILPALYREHGVAFAERLDGMYAIAVVDLRDEPTLVLVTDHAGMKSLYYQWDPAARRLCFASELPALLAFPGVDGAPWLERLDAYLATKTPFGERTMYERIRALPPAATAVCTRRDGLRVVTRPLPASDAAAPPADLATAGRELRELLRDEVERLLAADAPLCAIASGGLDSSVVAALAAQHATDLHTFHVAYRGDWPHDEREFARLAAQRAGTTHHLVELDPRDIPQLMPTVVWHLGQPNADPIAVSTYALFQGIRQSGFKVALSGDGADELLCGYDRLRTAMSAPAGDAWVAPYVESLGAVPRTLREALYTSEYRHHVAHHDDDAELLARELSATRETRLDALTELEAQRRLPAYHLRRVDHLSMAHGVETRIPFCQRRVAHCARRLPAELRVRGDEGKRALQRAAAGLVPEEVRRRPKQPFTLPIEAMMRQGEPLLELAREALDPTELRRHGLLDPRAVQRLLDVQVRRPSAQGALALWALMVHAVWVDQHAGTRRPSTDLLAEAA